VSLEELFRLRKIPIISVGITVDLNMESSTISSILFVGEKKWVVISSSEISMRVNCKRF
jgi:hypothetical protein